MSRRLAGVLFRSLSNRTHSSINEPASHLLVTLTSLYTPKKAAITALSDPTEVFKNAIFDLIRQNILRLDEILDTTAFTNKGEKSSSISEKLVSQLVQVKGGKVLEVGSDGTNPTIVFVSGLGQTSSPDRVIRSYRGAQEVFRGRDISVYIPKSELAITGDDAMSLERYEKGLLPYLNPNYIDEEESGDFFEKVIKPRFCGDAGELLAPEKCQRFCLFAHSIGVRETSSHMRWFTRYLRKNEVAEQDIEKYTKKILRLNLASPIVEGNEGGWAFNFSSLNDSGSKKPAWHWNNICLNPDFQASKISKVRLSEQSMLCVMGFGVVPDGKKTKDGFCHSASSYIDVINREKEFAPILAACDKFADPTVSDKDAFDVVDEIMKGAALFVPPQLSEVGIKDSMQRLHDVWREFYISRISSTETTLPNTNPVNPVCKPVVNSRVSIK